MKSSPKAPGAEIRFLWTERERFTKTTPFRPAGMSYHEGNVWVLKKKKKNRWGISENSCAALLAHSKHNDSVRGHPRTLTLSPPRFLLHQYTLMKGNAHATIPVMLHRRKEKITTCSAVTKKRSRTKAAKFKRGAYFPS